MEESVVLTRQDVIKYPSFKALKVAPDRIRPFREVDVDNTHNEFLQDEGGTHFFDLEGRRHQVDLGKCLCIGTGPEDRRTTSLEKVERYRYPVGDTDPEGFRLYKLKQARHLTCFDIPHPFLLDNENGSQLWECRHPSGGYIVWDHLQPDSPMRVIQRVIFKQTYERA